MSLKEQLAEYRTDWFSAFRRVPKRSTSVASTTSVTALRQLRSKSATTRPRSCSPMQKAKQLTSDRF